MTPVARAQTRNQTPSIEEELLQSRLFMEEPVGQQLAFYRSQALIRLVLGGNRAGKTACGARDVVWTITGTHPFRKCPPHGAKGWVVCETRDLANEVVIPKILEYLPPTSDPDAPWSIKNYDAGTDSRPASLTFHNCSKILFRTFSQGRRRFQSDAVDFVWGDEEMPQDIYRECLLRLVDLNGWLSLTMTPILGRTWTYTDIFEPWESRRAPTSEIECFQWSIWENTTLPRGAIQKTLDRIEDEVEREARENGTFLDRTGLVYKTFNPRVHVIDPFEIPSTWPAILAIDPAVRHPFGASLQVEDPEGNRFVVGEMRQAGLSTAQAAWQLFRLVDQTLPHLIKNRQLERVITSRTLAVRPLPPTFQRLFVVRDPSAASYNLELQQYGIPSRPGNRDLFTGLARIQTLFTNAAEGQVPGLYFFRGRTSGHLDEMRTYVWAKEKGAARDRPVSIHDDCLDAMRYGVMQPLSARSFARHPVTSRTGLVPNPDGVLTEPFSREDPFEVGAHLVDLESRRERLHRHITRRYSDEEIMTYLESRDEPRASRAHRRNVLRTLSNRMYRAF